MTHNLYVYILVMAGVTYLIRALPLTLIRKDFRNPFLKAFIFYVPYVTLSAMTFPSILRATSSPASAAAGLAAALVLAYRRKPLLTLRRRVLAVLLTEILMSQFMKEVIP